MRKHLKMFRVASIPLLVIYGFSLFLPNMAFGQESDCSFDRDNPTLASARKSFLALNYICAEEELNLILKSEALTTEEKADAHVLLAEVYYAKVRNDKEKHDKVITQFVAAFNAYREWKGELNIKSPEFMGMMKEAQTLVDQQAVEKPAEEAAAIEEAEKPAEEEETKEAAVPVMQAAKKPWYTKWWAIALGVGVVAGGVVLLTGGGEEEKPADNTLPDFPPPPQGKR